MLVFWFICFVVAAAYAVSAKSAVNRANEVIEGLSKKLEAVNESTESRKAKEEDLEAKIRHRLAEIEDKKQAALADVQKLEEETKRKINQAKAELEMAKGIRDSAEAVKEENAALLSSIQDVTNRWINDTFASICDKLTADNYATQEKRFNRAAEQCEKMGITFDGRQLEGFRRRLKTLWQKECEAKKTKEEQERIRELMREEASAEKARAAELKTIEKEEREISRRQKENEERLRLLRELESLKQLTEEQKKELQQISAENQTLAKELEEKERRKAMAELTRAGHVYVISNVGSFGESIFKVGMTRRLIPEDRIKELGDASVPFPFDIHLMVSTEDAPALESELHKKLWDKRLNLVNDHKEFFRTDVEQIKALIDATGAKVAYEYKRQAAALQWRESEERRKLGNIGSYDTEVEESDESEVA